jgi:hypothetical protein
MFHPHFVHLANIHRYVHSDGDRRWVFAVDGYASLIDHPEIPGVTWRCDDCRAFAAEHKLGPELEASDQHAPVRKRQRRAGKRCLNAPTPASPSARKGTACNAANAPAHSRGDP